MCRWLACVLLLFSAGALLTRLWDLASMNKPRTGGITTAPLRVKPLPADQRIEWANPKPYKEFREAVCDLQWSLFDYEGHHRTLYDLLGVNPAATMEEIRIAYLDAIQATHNSRDHLHGFEPSPLVALLSRSYVFLQKPSFRRQYDTEVMGRMVKTHMLDVVPDVGRIRDGEGVGAALFDDLNAKRRAAQAEVDQLMESMCTENGEEL